MKSKKIQKTLKYQKLSSKNKMFWFVEYCKLYDLFIVGEDIFENETIIGNIDFYNETVTINSINYLFRHFGIAIFENEKLHGEN